MKKVLLSFDIEEFDLPKEHGAEISLDEGVKVSAEGLEKILELCKKREVKATFFCTGNFALKRPDLIRQIVKDGHEVACHGVDHFNPKSTDVVESKKIVEKVAGAKAVGYRQPRMSPIDYKELSKCGYKYDSSVNPAFIPGRYNHLNTPRTPFMREDVLEIPTSVATFVRVPLFWLALHLFPVRMYVRMAKMSIKKTGYFTTYFHPWEFVKLNGFMNVPKYIKRNSGDKLVRRLEQVIISLKQSGYDFATYDEFVEKYYSAEDKK
ncbi:polysaccharide deacetylase family protein [Candidatus Saccharibacteria bacterium]|nr:polysaccharide deacetylase family protein [Candidatus Saccharibacteria bacterium]